MKNKKLIWLCLMFCLIGIVGCSSNQDTMDDSTTVESSKIENENRLFIDSAGREVTVPNKITKIAPSGSLAQLVLYTAVPDLLVGLANPLSAEAKEYVDKKYQELPTFGQFYGKSSNLNMEALSAAEPQVIIDIGEVKETVKEDMDNLQEQLSIPTIFIEANLENMSETYEKLGDLLNDETMTKALANYCNDVIEKAENIQEKLKDDERKSVYYASGNAGFNTNAEGSFHAQVLDFVGAKNVVSGIEATSKGSETVVSMEQIIQWQPDVILADSNELYQIITTSESWQELEAVKQRKVYKIPTAPYNFLGSPPSVNRILGVQWLGELLYPDYYQLDIETVVTEFYDLFYHVKPTSEELKSILEHAL